MNDDELELGHYGRIFRRSWWLLALSVVAAVLFALFALPSQRNFYESQVNVRLVPSLGDVGRINDPISEETEALVAVSVGDRVIEGSQFPETSLEQWGESLLVSACLNTGAIVVTNDCNTQILEFKYRASTPEKALYYVDRSAQTYLDARLERAEVIRDNTLDRLKNQLEDLDLRIQTEETILQNFEIDSVEYTLANIRLRRIEPERLDLRSQVNDLENTPLDVGFFLGSISTPQADSSGIPTPFAILAGIMMGLLLGGLAAIFLDRLDRRVSSPAETETDLGVPVLGDIPRITEGSPALVTAARPPPSTWPLPSSRRVATYFSWRAIAVTKQSINCLALASNPVSTTSCEPVATSMLHVPRCAPHLSVLASRFFRPEPAHRRRCRTTALPHCLRLPKSAT